MSNSLCFAPASSTGARVFDSPTTPIYPEAMALLSGLGPLIQASFLFSCYILRRCPVYVYFASYPTPHCYFHFMFALFSVAFCLTLSSMRYFHHPKLGIA